MCTRTVFLVVCLTSAAASPGAAQTSGSGKWEIEFHGGGMLSGNPTGGTVSLPPQGELFTSNPVATQKEEVERVQKALEAKINAAGDQEKKSALIATFLLPLARTNTTTESP